MNEREEQGTVTEPVAGPVNERPTEQPVPETRACFIRGNEHEKHCFVE